MNVEGLEPELAFRRVPSERQRDRFHDARAAADVLADQQSGALEGDSRRFDGAEIVQAHRAEQHTSAQSPKQIPSAREVNTASPSSGTRRSFATASSSGT